MNKKRKRDTQPLIRKSLPIEVITENICDNPLCLHGPTLLFSNEKRRYYACSLSRNKKDCPVHITDDDWQKDYIKNGNKKYIKLIPTIDKIAAWKTMAQVKHQHYTDRAYCVTCDELYTPSQTKKHVKDHKIVTPLTDEQLSQPSAWLPPLENDSLEAQYLFTKTSVNVILSTIMKNNIRNILCIGTLSVHEAASRVPDLKSLLLDYDKRYRWYHPPEKYLWYNMFNNFLFNKDDKGVLKKFMKSTSETGLCVVIDPPFGGRVEPLAHTLQQLTTTYRDCCEKPDASLPIIWAFPYFSEPYICNIMPEMSMHDYQVEYGNHSKFHNKKKGRKFGSPVRLFTNLPLGSVDLSHDKNYKFCPKCKYWVCSNNRHCSKCGRCTSKNGMTYAHCALCERCVKPSFFHCDTCGRCCQRKDHVCGQEVDSQACYNCKERGHKSKFCPKRRITHNK